MRRSLRSGSSAGAPAPVPGNLPAELNRFVGRAEELSGLAQHLDRSRLVTVVGVGGVGKTRLALRAAEELKKRYCDGVWLAELGALREPELLEHSLAEALGLTDQSGRPPRRVLVEHLAGRRVLLVLDGFEQLVDACAELVRELLRRAPELRVLATGRRPLRIDGELVFALAPMPEPDAVLLFTDRAAAGSPGFRPTRAREAAVRELCRRLDGIPLAVELAAGRLHALSVEQILDRMGDRFRVLTEGRRGAPARHRTLRTAIGWSHELCTPRERLLWARLSVFAGPFDLEAAEYVCGGRELPADDVLDVLSGLITQSLVVREETPAGVRYRMLDTVAAYGAEWLDALEDTGRLRRRHRDWYVGLATWYELEWFSPRQDRVAAGAESALPNLRAALELCLETPGEAHLGQHLAGTLWFYWVGCGKLAEGRHWLGRALALDSGHSEARLKALWVLGYVAVLQGDDTAAVGALHECREEAVRTGNAPARAYAVHRLGCQALLSDDMPRAERLLRAALDAYRELGELNSNVLMGQTELAMARLFQGDLDTAVALCTEVREICEDSGERWSRAYALYVLAYAAWTRGEFTEARALAGESIAIHHLFNDLVGLVLAVELMALVSAGEGDPAEAAVLQGAAAVLWESVGPRLFGSGFFSGPRMLCERQAGEALGARRYEGYEREGRGLSLDAAVRRALAGRPGPAAVPRQASGARGPSRTTRKPASSPTGKGGEAAG
ncbi:NACHT domain-containing protein [Streptomyces sp. GMY02]|uniref:ATP-binding protein n=1 Tax=Streptomyces sp. GMY02 TaxID=1333528 RepID=UPI001C2C67D1|nr:AAA family ATPase [Streptomyces sp. GMY02]QXE37847.1 NACHT domain-containing protein [Streptomyces sp. GMY02]